MLQRGGSGQNSALPTCECAVRFREGFSLLLRLYELGVEVKHPPTCYMAGPSSTISSNLKDKPLVLPCPSAAQGPFFGSPGLWVAD